VDTSLEPPEDAAEDEANAFPVGNTYNAGPRSVVVLVAR
jgi:hypothetical protein